MKAWRLFFSAVFLLALIYCKPGPSNAFDRIQEFTGLVIENKINPNILKWKIEGAGVGGDYIEEYQASFKEDELGLIISKVNVLRNHETGYEGRWFEDTCSINYTYFNMKDRELFELHIEYCELIISYQYTIE